MSTTTSTAPAPADAAEEKPRLRDAIRDNGLATAAMVLVIGVAVAGWSASFISLHDFAMAHMGLKKDPAWLVPSTFDGAALGLSLLSFRAAIYGRASVGSMVYVYAFTALSSWINWVHIDDHQGKFVSCLLPIAAVIVFGKVLKEAREAYERRHGKQVFKVRAGLLVLRWIVDRKSTREAIRSQILDIPVQALIGLGAGNLAREAAEQLAESEKAGEDIEGQDAEDAEKPGDPGHQEALALLRELFTANGFEVFQRVPEGSEVHTPAAVQDSDEGPAVNPGVNLVPVPVPATANGFDADGFTHVAFPHQIIRGEDLAAGSQNGLSAANVGPYSEAEDVNREVNLADVREEEPGAAEVHESEADKAEEKGGRVDAKTSQALILAGWFKGASASSIAAETGRTPRYIYRQLKALDEEHGPRPRKDDTGEIPAITKANGFAVAE
jgi:uncharacterized protein DUF2637